MPHAGASDACGHGHYWGQALQYLERSTRVAPGKLTLLFRIEAEKVAFRRAAWGANRVCVHSCCSLTRHHNSLKDGEGDWVEKPPWTITWGGGASVESPHFQRVHYCELLVRGCVQQVTNRVR